MSKKITAALNISIRTASKGPSAGSKFASVVGLLSDKSKAIEFDVNGADTVQALEDLAASFRSRGFAPIAEITCDGVSETPSMVQATAGVPAHARTWAGKPVHKLTGSATITAIVAKEALPSVSIAADLLEKAVGILDAE
jgi:phosphotransferase system HPr-like phosphotransfer protein